MKRKRKHQLWVEKMVMMGRAVRIMVRKDIMVKKMEIMAMREIMEKKAMVKIMVRRAKEIRVKKNKKKEKEKEKKDKGRRERKNRMGDQVNPQEINQLNNKPVKV
jgi:hypothetical protein